MPPGFPTNDPSNYLAFGKQSAIDTDATTWHFFKHLDGSGFEVETEIDRVREGGDGQFVALTYKTMVKADGNVAALARSNTVGRLWAAVLGSDSTGSAAVPSLARHTAAPVASLAYFTFEQRYADVIERGLNCQLTGLTVEGEAGKPWRYTANFLNGGTVTFRDVASTLTATRQSDKPYFYPNGSYSFDGFASYAKEVTKWKVEVTRGVDDGIQTTGLNRSDLVPLNFDVNVDATIKYTSKDFYRQVKFTGGSVVPVNVPTGSLDLAQIQMVTTGAGAVASSVHRINIPLLEWVDAKVNKLEPDGQTMYLDVVGMNVQGSGTHAIYAQTDTNEISSAY
jgi:hypothetical protein